ncbi:DUF4317 domain-containing protein [Lachnospiraceae bacterium OttesenSCG-928-D06]|nr:DUF4317 domain-containing protein [Lachnospiraceae bacterium OttesenSCG-928-D06]
MIKQEVAEIKKLYTPKNCSITRICGCYVDGEKNKKTQLKQAFLALPEEEMFKYFEIFRKSLSGSIGKNLLTLDFPLAAESEGGTQEFLLKLRDSKLKDDELLESYYDKIIEAYEFVGNYLILVIHDVYDIPGKSSDGILMDDASDEVYEYLLTCICPVNLSKPGLSYDDKENTFHNRIRDWVVSVPDVGILFPAFQDRSTDIHSALYYTKSPDELPANFIEQILGCPLPLSAGDQKETFQAVIEETLGDQCDFEAVRNIHDKLNEMVEEHKEEAEPFVLNKNEMKTLLASSGVSNECMEVFEEQYDETAGEDTSFVVSNVINSKNFELKTPDITIKVNPDRTDLIETKVINGRSCLVIELDGSVVVNGIAVRNSLEKEEEED